MALGKNAMSDNKVRKQWREKHRTRSTSSLREGLGPLQLNSVRSRGLALAAIALTAGVVGATVTGQVFAYKMSQLQVASLAPVEQAKPAIEMTTIVVASRPLRFGERVDASNLREVPWVAGSEPQGAFRTVADVLIDNKSRSVLSAMEIDEPVLAGKITGPGQRATLAALVDENMRAITVPVDEVYGVAGFVLPGDRVDVMLTRNTRAGDPLSSQADVLLQDVRVLAIDQVADDRLETPAVSRAVTLEVSPQMAQKLVLGASVGRLSLILRPTGVDDKHKTSPIAVSDLTGEVKAKSTINIIRGSAGSAVRVAQPQDEPAAAPAANATSAPAIAPTPRVAGAPTE
jgi:pilus assembly protein CpaB